MNRRFVYTAILITLLTASNAWASAFSIVDVHNEILGAIGGPTGGLPFSQQYDLTSSDPLLNEIFDTNVYDPSTLGGRAVTTFNESIAAGPFVYVALDQRAGTAESVAEAISAIDFTPTFDGSAAGIFFLGANPLEGWFSGPRTSWTITDLTSNSLVASDTAHVRSGDFYQSLAFANGSDYSWDSTHTYQLQSLVQVGSNQQTDSGWISTNMFAINVPEPSTVLLLSFGLMGLVAFRRAAIRTRSRLSTVRHT